MIVVGEFRGLESLLLAPLAAPRTEALARLGWADAFRARWLAADLLCLCATLKIASVFSEGIEALVYRTPTTFCFESKGVTEGSALRSIERDAGAELLEYSNGDAFFFLGVEESSTPHRMGSDRLETAERSLRISRARALSFLADGGSWNTEKLSIGTLRNFDETARTILDQLGDGAFEPGRTIYLDIRQGADTGQVSFLGLGVSFRNDTYLKPLPGALFSRDMLDLGDIPVTSPLARLFTLPFELAKLAGKEKPDTRRGAVGMLRVNGYEALVRERLKTTMSLERLNTLTHRFAQVWSRFIGKNGVFPLGPDRAVVVGGRSQVASDLTALEEAFRREFAEEGFTVSAAIDDRAALVPTGGTPDLPRLPDTGITIEGKTFSWRAFENLSASALRIRSWVQRGVVPKLAPMKLKQLVRSRLDAAQLGDAARCTVALAAYLNTHFPARSADEAEAKAANDYGKRLLSLFDGKDETTRDALTACADELRHAVLSLKRG